MADRQQARGAVDRRPEIITIALFGDADVQRHPHTQRLPARQPKRAPILCAEYALGG